LNRIYKRDAVEGMNILYEKYGEFVDLIVTDPPYKIVQGGAKTKGKNAMGGSLSQGSDNVSKGTIFDYNDTELKDWIPAATKLLKEGAFFYCFTNSLNMRELLNIANDNKLKLNNILVMVKDNCVVNQWYMKNVEYVCFFRKGKAKPLNDRGLKTAIEVIMPRGEEKVHPTQKPYDYIEMLVKNSSQEGEIVLDPFMGSGTTAKACEKLKRRYIGFEIDEKYNI
jgi:DNA modification methylase